MATYVEHYANQRFSLLSAALAAAVTGQTSDPVRGLAGSKYIGLFAALTYGTGGTSANFIVQTTFDSGANWLDIASIAFATGTSKKFHALVVSNVSNTTPTSGVLSANSLNQGIIGDELRVFWGNAGTYSATTVVITAVAKG